MDPIRYAHRHADVACQLDSNDAVCRVAEWQRLRASALGSTAIPKGIRLWLPVETLKVADELARREAECCGFLDIELAEDGGLLRLDIISVASDAAPIITAIVGGSSPPAAS